MGRGRDFRGGGGGRGRHAHDEDKSFVLAPTALYPRSPAAHRPPTGDGSPVDATVKWFNPERGCGFVEIADGSGDAFLSVKALQAVGRDTVSPGAKLNVLVSQGEKGRHVTKIVMIGDSGKSNMPTHGTSSATRPESVEANLPGAKEVLGKVKYRRRFRSRYPGCMVKE